LIGDYIPTATQKTIEESILLLKKKLEELNVRLDPKNINKDEFSEIFKSSYYTILRSHKKEKIRAAVNLILNILLKDRDPDKLCFTEVDHFSKCIEQLSIGSYIVLTTAIEITNIKFDEKIQKELKSNVFNDRRFNFNALVKRLPQLPPSLLMGLVGELDSMNLLHRAGPPPVRIHSYGNYPIELTAIGVKFVFYLIDQNENS